MKVGTIIFIFVFILILVVGTIVIYYVLKNPKDNPKEVKPQVNFIFNPEKNLTPVSIMVTSVGEKDLGNNISTTNYFPLENVNITNARVNRTYDQENQFCFFYYSDQCYVSKICPLGISQYEEYDVYCIKKALINITQDGKISQGTGSIDLNFDTSDGYVNGMSICIMDWSLDIITANLSSFDSLNPPIDAVRCYYLGNFERNSTIKATLNYYSLGGMNSYVLLQILDKDRDLNSLNDGIMIDIPNFFDKDKNDLGILNFNYTVK